MSITVSIITPSYNQARFIDDTLRSVLSQRDQVHEYFLLDGGSTDNTMEIVDRYADRIDHVVSEKDKGQSDAIHKGFARATGDVLAWINSDDVLLPGMVKQVRDAFERHPEWDVLTAWHVTIDAETRVRSAHRLPSESVGWMSWGVMHVCQQTCFFKRSLYEKLGGLNLELHCVMDTEMWLRMLSAGARWGHIPQYTAAFRVHDDMKGKTWLKRYAEENAMLCRSYPQYPSQSLKGTLGRAAHRTQQVLSGRHPAALLDSRRMRGRKLEDVFGAWSVT